MDYTPDNKSQFLYFGFGLLLILFVYVVLHSYELFSDSSKNLRNETNNNDIQMSAALSMRVAVRERAILLWHMTLMEDAFLRDDDFSTFYDFGSSYQQARQRYLQSQLTAQERQLLLTLDKEASSRAPVLRQFADLLMNDEGHDSYTKYLNRVLSDQVVVADILDEMIQLQQEQNSQAGNNAAQTIENILFQLIIWIGILVIAGVIFARIVVHSANQQNIKLAEANNELIRLARHDHLTGLPNRMFLLEHLEMNLSLAQRHQRKGAVLFIDLDGFKPINDNYGHEIGDLYLQTAGKKMQQLLRDSDMLARLGGDEFVVILFEISTDDHALVVADKLLAKLSETYTFSDISVKASASIGICYFPDEQMTVDSLIKCADNAMYQAKKSGKNRYYVSSSLKQNDQ